MDLINQKEAEQKAKEEEKEEAQKEFTGTYRLLAVTACPTGIAHTYMSAEALEEKVKEMMPNHQIPKLIKVDNVIEYMLIGQMVLCLEEVK